MGHITNKSKASDLFIRADKCDDRGDFKGAFRLMLAAARLGDVGAQLNVGNYYDGGKGVPRNRSVAMYWYKRAYRRGDSSAAFNIGVMWRNEKQFERALSWFVRSAKLGNDGANLEIAKYYLDHKHDPLRAVQHLKQVTNSAWVSEAELEEAAELLKIVKGRAKARSRRTSH